MDELSKGVNEQREENHVTRSRKWGDEHLKETEDTVSESN